MNLINRLYIVIQNVIQIVIEKGHFVKNDFFFELF